MTTALVLLPYRKYFAGKGIEGKKQPKTESLSQIWQHDSWINHTYKCSAESTSRCFSFPLGILWSMTIVSVFAKQNPFDRMISVRGRKKNKMREKKRKLENNCMSYVVDMIMKWDMHMTLKICTGKQKQRVCFIASNTYKLPAFK